MQRKTPASYDVEVVTADGQWAQFGPTLPDLQHTPSVQSEYRRRAWGIRLAATALTMALHVALVGSALLGSPGRPPQKKPLNEGASASSPSKRATEFVSVMLLLNDHSITPPDQVPDDSAYAPLKNLERSIQDTLLVTSIDTPTLPEFSGSKGGSDANAPTAEAAGDEAGRAMMFGRYMGQIKARIDRIWSYPVAAASNTFQCKVQIKQSIHGEVQEVTLQHCNDDPVWQMSLVKAIQSASPLSAPPSDSVFTDVITLNFDAIRPQGINAQSGFAQAGPPHR